MKRKAKPKKVLITKGSLTALSKELADKLDWATKIIQTQQGEIDRLIGLNAKLTSILDQFSRRD